MSDEDDEYDRRRAEAEANLRPKLTDEFLNTLALATRTCGRLVDHQETVNFVEWCFDIADKPRPELPLIVARLK
jgi:hypothetical protein